VSRQSLFPLFEWYGHSFLGKTISASSFLIAFFEIIHLIGMTLLIGTILAVDLTLLGFGMRKYPVSRLGEDLRPWTRGGLAVMLMTGPLLLSSEALRCFDSSSFWAKMGLLTIALVFHFTVHRRVVMAEPAVPPLRSGLVACTSLALWTGVALAAKFIGIFGDDLRQQARLFS
jgi:hypothetical protein